MTQELIERLGHTDELSGDSVWEVREALKKQAAALERLTAELENWKGHYHTCFMAYREKAASLLAEREANEVLNEGYAKLTAERDALKALLEEAISYTSCTSWSPSLTDEIKAAIQGAKK